MVLQNKIEQYIREIKELEKSFFEVQHKEILPLSFFSSSIDILNRLKKGVYEIEAIQLQMMQDHINESESDRNSSFESNEPGKASDAVIIDGKIIPTTGILADTISRKINPNFEKSLSLNDRFMFQRDLFGGSIDEMNQAFSQLNTFQSMSEVLDYLNKNYAIPWNSDSGIALKELLDKRFA